eukprot:CAMPEP_0179190276 /NCGR_PEP_ID=MMETSP0796-20121207/94473_1 /TAXON_ID=73915 /ORGANISM="Pyrodinium bahamense, Strain pbaha01" /LENGTH=66 /DNA_ID=CAMNT_0020894435 /DNA_START=892 /DNA_END=1089 /DNA_ORIENTATION=+
MRGGEEFPMDLVQRLLLALRFLLILWYGAGCRSHRQSQKLQCNKAGLAMVQHPRSWVNLFSLCRLE